nr:hypothetical protein [Arthrobacter koreensis]
MHSVDAAEKAVTCPERNGGNIHPHLIDEAGSECLSTDVTGGNFDYPIAGQILGPGNGCLNTVGEEK